MMYRYRQNYKPLLNCFLCIDLSISVLLYLLIWTLTDFNDNTWGSLKRFYIVILRLFLQVNVNAASSSAFAAVLPVRL